MVRENIGRIKTALRVRSIRVPKRVRRIIAAATVLFVLLLGVGVAYTWFMDQQPALMPSAPASDTATYAPITPTRPAPDAREGVSVQMVSSPVAVGTGASVSVQTNPTSTCTIAVVYNYDYSKKQTPASDPALAPQTADDYGLASWTWTVVPSAPAGLGKATVTCVYHGRSAVVQADIDVTK